LVDAPASAVTVVTIAVVLAKFAALFPRLFQVTAFVIGLAAVHAVTLNGAIQLTLFFTNFAVTRVVTVTAHRRCGPSASKHHQGAQQYREHFQVAFHNGLLGNEEARSWSGEFVVSMWDASAAGMVALM
jgi:hypothetical protein